MGTMWLLIGLALGAGATVLVARSMVRTRVAVVTGERDAALQEAADAREQHAAAVAERDKYKDALQETSGELGKEVVRLTTELKNARAAGDEQRRTVEEVKDNLLTELKAICGDVVKDQSGQLVRLAKAEFGAARAKADGDLERRQKSVEELVEPITRTLSSVNDRIEALDRDRRTSQTQLSEQLRAVVEAQRELRTETSTLSRALRQPHTRGQWGEMHLKRAAELAGMVEHCDFELQQHLDDDGRLLRPDMVVNLPGGKHVPVDAKSPVQPYLDAMDAADDTSRAAHLQLFARGLRAHVKSLGAKSYWAQFDSSPEFVLLHLPNENFLIGALEVDSELIEYAARQRIFLATPSTLMVMLRAVAFGWQQERVAEEARSIAQLGRRLYRGLVTYLEHVQTLGKRVNSLVNAYNASVGSLQRSVLPSARKLPELGAVAADEELPELAQTDRRARQLQAPEALEAGEPDGESDGRSLPAGYGKAANSGDIAPAELPEPGEGMEAA
jgi:DNA recombination protein RmuC